MASSDLERTFDTLWVQLGGQTLTCEHWFVRPCADGASTAHTSQHASPSRLTAARTTGPARNRRRLTWTARNSTPRRRGLEWLIFRLTSDMRCCDDPVTHLGMIRDKIGRFNVTDITWTKRHAPAGGPRAVGEQPKRMSKKQAAG